MNPPSLTTQVDATSERIRTTIADARQEVLETFLPLNAAQQTDLASDAWQIGVRALKNAYAQATEARLADIGTTLKADLSQAMAATVQQHHERLGAELRKYLDPQDGEFARRLDQFVDGSGELAQRLAEFASPDGGMLAETLARQVGEQSVLFRKLSPTDSEGVIQTLKQQLVASLAASNASVAASLDPLNADSPVGRFLNTLRLDLKASESDRSAQMSTAFKALDANDPNSLLSNLARKTQEASRSMLAAMNPADPDSPLALLKNTLTELLETHVKSSSELFHAQDVRQREFETRVLEAVAKLEVQRAHSKGSTQGGLEFEDLAAGEVQAFLCAAPVICARTGNVVGIRSNCKVGDLVARFTDESAWAGTSIVFEFKQDSTYGVEKAIRELDTARANREASVGVFVMAHSHAPGDFPVFSRHGHNILVTLDSDDVVTTHRLHAAVMLAMALASRKHAVQDTASIEALKGIETVLTEQLTRIEKMRKASEAIRKHNETLRKELDKAEADLEALTENAREAMALLGAGQHELAERAEPINFNQPVPRAAGAA